MSCRSPSLLVLALVSAVAVWPASGDPSWSHSDQASWPADFPLCGGARQTPVQLEPAEQLYWDEASRPQARFPKGLKAGRLTASNTGHTLVVELQTEAGEPAVQLKGAAPGPLIGLYTLDSLHLHWNDPAGGRGAEHSVNGSFEQAEAHFVFFNQQYGSVSAALEHTDGLAVVGLLLRPSPALSLSLPTFGLENDLAQLAYPGSSPPPRAADLRPLRRLLRSALSGLYSYEGSLTTPPCSPVVTWLVVDRPVSVDAQFLQQLRTGLYADAAGTELIQNNWRELQDLDGRTVVRYSEQQQPL